MKALDPELLARMGDSTAAGRESFHGHVHSDEGAAELREDLANGVLFLASDLSAFVTGTTLHVDGGTMAAAGFIDWPFEDGYLPVPMDGTLSRLFRPADEQRSRAHIEPLPLHTSENDDGRENRARLENIRRAAWDQSVPRACARSATTPAFGSDITALALKYAFADVWAAMGSSASSAVSSRSAVLIATRQTLGDQEPRAHRRAQRPHRARAGGNARAMHPLCRLSRHGFCNDRGHRNVARARHRDTSEDIGRTWTAVNEAVPGTGHWLQPETDASGCCLSAA